MNAGPDFSDRIGDRLDHPERVPEHLKHLIPDDKARVEWILSHPVSGRVLEVGCSDGAISRRIVEKWGVDVRPCDMRYRDDLPNFKWWDIRHSWWGDVWTTTAPLDMEEADFDAVFCTEVLEHLFPHEGQIALANLWAVLKPGGQLIVTVPNRYPDEEEFPTSRHRWEWPDHRQYFTWPSLSNLLTAQFSRVEVFGIPVTPYAEGIWLGAVCTK